MEHYFNYQCQFLKEFDVKPQRKRKKLLSREYLQPSTEHDEEENSVDDQTNNSYRKKLKCVYEAAKFGMKEGMLTGVFFGGCWGIFKLMQGHFQFGVLGFNTYVNKQKDLKSEPSANSFAPNSTKDSITLVQAQNISATNSNKYLINISKNTKSVSEMREKFQEKKFFNSAVDEMVYNVNYRKLPVRFDDQLPLLSAGLFETNKLTSQRSRKNVEIVGYAFIQTTGSISSSGSNEYGSPKDEESATSTNEEYSPKNTPEGSNHSGGGPSSKGKGPPKISQKKEIHEKTSPSSIRAPSSNKNKSQLLSSTVGSKTSSHSRLPEKKIEFNKSLLPDLVEESPNETYKQHQTLHNKNVNETPRTEKGNFLISDDRTMNQKKNNLMTSYNNTTRRSNKSGFRDPKVSDLLSTNTKQPSQPPFKMRSDAKEKHFKKTNKKDTFDHFGINQKITDDENIYPSSKKIGSIFVDIDEISNGFTSPPDTVQSTDLYESSDSQQSATWLTSPHNIEKVRLKIENLKFTDSYNSPSYQSKTLFTEMEDYNKYKVETSPTYETSLFTANTEEGKRGYHSFISDTTYDIDSRYEKYMVETSPAYKKSLASVTSDRKQDEMDSMSDFSKTLLSNSTSSFHYSHYDIKTLTLGGSPYNFTEEMSLDSETSKERSGISFYEKPEGNNLLTNESHINKKYTTENRKPEGKSSVQHETLLKETPTNAVHSYDKSGSKLFMLSNEKPSYEKSYVSETRGIKRHSPESIPSQKSGISEMLESKRYSPASIPSQKSGISEMLDSKRYSPPSIPSQKSGIGETLDSKRYSPPSIPSQKSGISETLGSKRYSPPSIPSQKSGISETLGSKRYSPPSIPSQKSGISETLDSKRYSPPSIPSQKSGISETLDSKRYSPPSIPSQKSGISETLDSKRYSPPSIPSQKSGISETLDSKRYSPASIPSQKSGISETLESKIYSPTNIPSQKSDVSDPYLRNAKDYSLESSLTSNKSYVSESQNISYLDDDLSYDRLPANQSYAEREVAHSDNDDKYATDMRSAANSSPVYRASQNKADDIRSEEIKSSNAPISDYLEGTTAGQQIPMNVNDTSQQTQQVGHSHISPEGGVKESERPSTEVAISSYLTNKEQPLNNIRSEKMPSAVVQKKPEVLEERKMPQEFHFLTSVNESILVISACNCAVVLGVVCSVLSTTRASLAV